MLLLLPDEMLLKLIHLSVLAGDFSTEVAASVLGQGSCPSSSLLLLRRLHSLGLVERGAGHDAWRLPNAVRSAAAELSINLRLPLISVR